MCYDSYVQEDCACGNEDYPHNWAGVTCGSEQDGSSDGSSDGTAMADRPLSTVSDYVTNHNDYRAEHCETGPLVWNERLEREAQEYAETCPTDHYEFLTDGENLYWGGYMNGGTPDGE